MSAGAPTAPGSSDPGSWVDRFAMPLLGLALLAGLLLRVREAMRTPMWFEEIYIAMVSQLRLPQVVGTIGQDIHPPLGYVLEHFWIQLGGMHDGWLKALPITLAILALLACFAMTRRMFGTAPALLAVTLIALTHGHARLITEVQPFALESLLVTLAVGAAWQWLETRRTSAAIAYIVFGGCACYTHYVSLAILLTVFICGAITLRGDRAAFGRWIAMHVLIALIFAPQAPIQYRQFLMEDAIHHGHLPTRADWLELMHVMALGATYLIPAFLALALLPWLDPKSRRAAGLLWAVSFLPLLSLRVWSINFPRETLWVLPMFVPLVAAGVMRLPGRWLRAGVMAVLLVIAIHGNLKPAVFGEPVMLMRAKQELDRDTRPGDIVLSTDTHSFLFFRFHDHDHALDHRLMWRGDEPVPYFDGGLMILPEWRMTPEQLDSLEAHDARWWVVTLNRSEVRSVHGHNRANEYADSLLSTVPGAKAEDLSPVKLWQSPRVVQETRGP